MLSTRHFFEAFIGLFLLGVLPYSSCLKCYSCDSIMNKDCANINEVSEEYLIDCSSVDKLGMKRENPVCYLAHGKVNLMIAEGGAVVRGCTEKPLSENACSNFVLPGFHFVGLNCSTCTEDRCNGEFIATVAPSLIMPTVTISTPKKNGAATIYPGTAGVLILALWSLLVSKS